MTDTDIYLTAAGLLAIALALCIAAMLRGSLVARLVALEAAGVVTTLLLTALAVGMHRTGYLVAPLALACLSAPGSLIFAHVIERWLEEDPCD